MARVVFENVSKTYPRSAVPAVDGLNLDIDDGEVMVLVGPSGCGKSTSLRMLAGLEEVTAGRITVGGRDVTDLPPKDRDIAMVFQSYALYPHMTVAENMGFALKMEGVKAAPRRSRVAEVAELLRLSDLLDRRPRSLSGGQRQRVAMGRAIIRQPQVFCMDEPLSNLDAQLRVSTRAQIAALQERLGITTVYVTHDQTEAMTMGDRVAVLRDGTLQQVDAPLRLYDDPVNMFVATFIGSPAMNIIDAKVAESGGVIGGHLVPLPTTAKQRRHELGDRVKIGLRPESLRLAAEGVGLPLRVVVVEELGPEAFLYGMIEGRNLPEDEPFWESNIVVRVPPRVPFRRGSQVWVEFDASSVYMFSETGDRIATVH